MIKLNWGYRIALLYISFVALMILMVALCMRQKTDLVSEDYYANELAFQNRINATENANALSEKITTAFRGENIELAFPALFRNKNVTGEILFFRPSDAQKDFRTPVHLNPNGAQTIPLGVLSKGMYKLQITWQSNGTGYFSEETIVIP